MLQQGQVFELETNGVDGKRLWAFRYRVGGRGTRDERERAYLQLFFDDVLGARFRYKLPYPVRRRSGAPPRDWIVHASDFFDAAML